MKNTMFDHSFWMTLGRRVTSNFLESTLHVIGIVVVYLVLRNSLRRIVEAVTARMIAREDRLGAPEERTARLKTLSGLFTSLVQYLLVFVFAILIFKAVGFDILPFITTASVVGLAIGIGAQKLVKDVISGFFIIVDNMYVVGDYISVGTVTGEVQEMGMRVTRIKDASGRVVFISNGDIGQVINLSRNPVEDFIEVVVAAGSDLNVCATAVQSTGTALMNEPVHYLKEPPRVIGVSAFSAASVTLRVCVISEPKHLASEQMRVREAVRDAFDRAKIQAV